MSGYASRIRTSQDKDGMLRRALERIIQLYTDKSHFVYELLQNAEDAEAHCIKFVQYDDRLEVYHDGKPFTEENLQGLCDIGKSDKIDNLNQIGEFGVGFKSVFGICETVKLYSKPENYRTTDIGNAVPFSIEIFDFTRPEDIETEEVENGYTTRFVFPYAVGNSYSGFKTLESLKNTLSKKLKNLGITTLLFMKNLELIEYKIETDGASDSGEYILDKKIINDHCELVSAMGNSESQTNQQEENIKYLKFFRQIPYLKGRTVDIAFPISIDEKENYICQKPQSPYVSVYFPTETESKLNFIVQGPYRTTPNRSSIPGDDEDNERLADLTAYLLRTSILELRDQGKLNMSFLRALPVSISDFDYYSLFYPIHYAVKDLFSKEAVLPCNSGGYARARFTRIARQEKLATLFPDKKLSELISDGNNYKWLPTLLTETNREYDQVYRFLTSTLKIPVVRPDDLRFYFSKNKTFLPNQTEDWLVELYSLLENLGALFSKSKNEINMLTANIVKTSTGSFVAAYRKSESKQYIENVFLPSPDIQDAEIFFVDQSVYDRCRHFFDEILALKKPDEYALFTKDVKRRYEFSYEKHEMRHIKDTKTILRYYTNEEYRDEILDIIRNRFKVKCKDNQYRNPFSYRVYVSVSNDGVDIEHYLQNISTAAHFVDDGFYSNFGISISQLLILGVKDSITSGETITQGVYDLGSGKSPTWSTLGAYRWKFSIDHLKEALSYISDNPEKNDAILKSKAIMRILFNNEDKLCGDVKIGGSIPNLTNECCELVKILRGERLRNWSGKWLYREDLTLAAPKDISKHDLNSSIYGKIKADSQVYDLLRFRISSDDEVEQLRRTTPKRQLEAYFESELKSRFGITSLDLERRYCADTQTEIEFSPDKVPFPLSPVRNWETLRKHAAEMMCYADPVKYERVLRRIRVSNRDKETKSYLHGMYRCGNTHSYACQMCHDSTASVESAELFSSPKRELDPINLCLCPSCATEYRKMRSDVAAMLFFRKKILDVSETEINESDYISLQLRNVDIWFTPTHFAEIQELLKLTDKLDAVSTVTKISDSNEQAKSHTTLDAKYNFIGKTMKRSSDGFTGKVKCMNDKYLTVEDVAGKERKFEIDFIINNPNVYTFE